MKDLWTNERIKVGFDRFKALNGRLPTGPEIDKLDYLPSSRLIQMKFGGLEALRNVLGYEHTHFGKGVFRREIAIRSGVRGRETELTLEKILRDKFGEVFVHTEKIFDDSKTRVDFYVYSPDGNFGIDVFYTETIKDLQKNLNLKIDKYKNFPSDLYLTVANDAFSRDKIHIATKGKTKALSTENTQVVNLEMLYEVIRPMRSYPNPLV